jgi:GDP-L-fucose synthase
MSFAKILVTGASGFLGRHTLPALKAAYPDREIVPVSSADANLTDFGETIDLLKKIKPDAVVHLAAYSGGIGANRTWPADFFWRNLSMVTNMYEACSRLDIKRIIYTMGGCSYPGKATSPIGEDQMWEGYPQVDSAAYSTETYQTQHGISSTVLVPGNLFGEFDNFRNGESHVIPAFVRRFHEAKLSGTDNVTCWGTGIAQRDFVYAGDVAAAIPFFIDRVDVTGPVNLSQGATMTIRELAETVAEVTGLKAEIRWDKDKPEGQLVKIFDVATMHSLGLECPTSLRDGLVKTYEWLQKNYDTAGDGLRL